MSSLGKAGLEDVVVSTTDICFIDGREGRLVYRGFDVGTKLPAPSWTRKVLVLAVSGEGATGGCRSGCRSTCETRPTCQSWQ